MKILSLCGSLRSNSTNGYLLKAAKSCRPNDLWVDFNLADLPYFDPDNQYSVQTPQVVLEFRNLGATVDAIFIATPEYAHGLPGILKNALEWLFHEGTMSKPVFVVIGTAQGDHTRDQLIEIIKTMDFKINPSQVLLLKGVRSKIDTAGAFSDSNTRTVFEDFCKQIGALK
ncbi:MAG: hypothetical protein B7Y39_12390 [Bdellovibrio sp. 28-41-41]|nr:MAG: hypothetical protein B7Y39_12390 [Bdellovibrio sp. 28-41-41]